MDGDFAHHANTPQSPETIKVKMLLKTLRSGKNKDESLDWRNSKTIAESTFDHTKPTFIFVHGFWSNGSVPWLLDLVNVRMSSGCL